MQLFLKNQATYLAGLIAFASPAFGTSGSESSPGIKTIYLTAQAQAMVVGALGSCLEIKSAQSVAAEKLATMALTACSAAIPVSTPKQFNLEPLPDDPLDATCDTTPLISYEQVFVCRDF